MRVIIETNDPDEFTFAIRAARWLIGCPTGQRDAILSYGDNHCDWYVKRTKSGISVRRVYHPTDDA